MSLRTKVVASIAVAASAFLLVPAAAQAATHPVQVTGAQLKTALLPTSTFGSDFKVLGATSSGTSLWPTKAVKHASTMSCVNFENAGAVATGKPRSRSRSRRTAALSPAPPNLDNLNLLYDQSVYQFASTKAASAFYNQAYAKYASCKSFTDTLSGDPNGASTITLKSIAKTKVGTHQAFQLTQIVKRTRALRHFTEAEHAGHRKGADVFIFVNGSTTNRPVPAKTMLKLINRVAALR